MMEEKLLQLLNTDEGKISAHHISQLHAGEGAELLVSVQTQTGAASSWRPPLTPSWMFFQDWEQDWEQGWDWEWWLRCWGIPCFRI